MSSKDRLYKCLQFGLVGVSSCLNIFWTTNLALAQQSNIIPDNTLGAESSRLNRNVLINGINADTIDGGARRNSNLFHSFSEFNINDGQAVYFANPDGIQNILTRVTGGNQSNILGTLGVNGAANLFLINPNGIVFGENASLDLQGSFLGTTASGIQFGEQGNFSATNPQTPGNLTINPSALFFNQVQASGGIINKSQGNAGINPNGDETTGLRVPDGKSLLLVGGDINLDGGKLRAYEGNVELASVTSPGTIGLDISGNTFNLNVPENVERGDVSLTDSASVSIFGAGGGNLVINARNLEISNSSILAGISQNSENPDARSGDVNLNATGFIKLTDSAGIDNSVYSQGNAGNIFLEASNSISVAQRSIIANNIRAGGVGKAGNISINSGSLSLTDGSEIQASLRDADFENDLPGGQGNLGNIDINVRDAVNIAGIKDGFSSGIYSFVGIGAIGNVGDININADSLSLAGGSEINAKTLGQGNAGNITVNARKNISLDGSGDVSLIGGSNGTPFTRIISSVNPEATGNAGNIQFNTGNLSVTNGAVISSSISGKGDAGNITINVRDTISFDTNSSVDSRIFTDGVGKGGDIRVKTGTITLTNGSQLATTVTGEGNAGNIFVEARDGVKLDGFFSSQFNGEPFDKISAIQSNLETGGVGKGGDIQIATKSLSVSNRASISATSGGKGDAGNITINVTDTATFDNLGNASSEVGLNGVGNGGEILFTAGELLLTNGGDISTNNFGQGDGGDVFLDVRDTISFDGVANNGLPSGVKTFASNGDSGDVDVKTSSLLLTNSAQISTIGFGEENSNNIANGGDIKINARDTIKLDGANTALRSSLLSGIGKGGDIQITTGSLSVTGGAQISANTNAGGDAGNININARDTVTFDGIGTNNFFSSVNSVVASNAVGNGGDININTKELFVTNGASLNTLSFGEGNAGNVFINAIDSITFDGVGSSGIASSIQTFTSNNGDAGEIQLTTGLLSVTNGARLITSTTGEGDAGKITINAGDRIIFDGVGSNNRSSGAFSTVESSGVGNAGEIELTTGTLSVTNGARLTTLTTGEGDAGKIKINAGDRIIFDGVGSNNRSSGAFSTVESSGVGNAGDIELTTGTLSVSNGAEIKASTLGEGNGGKIDINASESVNLSDVNPTGVRSTIETLAQREASGNPGDINVTTNKFRITDGALVSTSTGNNSKAGNININANDFEAFNSGRVLAITVGSGDAGSINLNVKDKITLSGTQQNVPSGLFAITTAQSTGKGGSIFIDPRLVVIENGAGVSVGSFGTEDAGDIFLQAGTLQLDNGFINAETASTKGGNIDLQISELLLLRNESQITTTAGTAQAGGDGGNIDINSKFIVAPQNENSDITANAFKGNGGKVNINSSGIFGIESQESLTLKSDITASSEEAIAGETNINAADTSSIQNSFTEISPNIDTDAIIANSCIVRSNKRQENSFTITGSGGLRNSPGDELISIYSTGEVRNVEATTQPWKKGDPIIEPQGLYRLSNGELLLSRECSG